MNVKVQVKEIDFKSLLIGFLLAVVLFLTLGAGNGTQDVRIVGVSTYDELRVRVEEVNSSAQMPVKIKEVEWGVEVPVTIEEQPIEVKTR